MERSLTLLKREIGARELAQINRLIETAGERGRTYISKQLCQVWDWRLPNGRLRDIACRELLRRLEQRGLIQLPAPRHASRKPGYHNTTMLAPDFVSTPRSQSLQAFGSIEIAMVRGRPEEALYNAVIGSYHYLGYHQGAGEQLKYLIRGDGPVLAAIGFGGAAFQVAVRDQHLGWDHQTRKQQLVKVVNNTRFLILPWSRVPHLASHILGRLSRRIRADWQDYYNRDIVLLETFVEHGRFNGTCYQAANWRYLGQTTGRGRNDRHRNNCIPIKDIYIYPLDRRYQQLLRGER
jgi:hypothetical protein